MFPNTAYGTKHMLTGPTLSRAELSTVSALVATTVAVTRSGRFEVAFDTAEDLHIASIILAALRRHDFSGRF